MTNEILEALKRAKAELVSAKARNSGVQAAREKMKNLLYNYYDDLIAAVVENEKLKADMLMLESALEDSDRENDELRKQIKAMKAQAEE